MIKLSTLTPGPRSGRALLALLAATAVLAGAELALAPASAPALQAEECEPNEPGPCGLPDEGVPGGDSSEGNTQPGEIIEIVDSKPQENPWPEPQPVKTPPVDLGPLLGDKLGSGRGDQSGQSDLPEIFTRKMGCGKYMQALQEAAASAQDAPAGKKNAVAQALQDARVRYVACQKMNIAMTIGPPGECAQIRRERDNFLQAGNDMSARVWSFMLATCIARDGWEQTLGECGNQPGSRNCELLLTSKRRTLYLQMEGYMMNYARYGWQLGFKKNGRPWWQPGRPRR